MTDVVRRWQWRAVHDRVLVFGALALLVGVSWFYLVRTNAGMMPGGGAMPDMRIGMGPAAAAPVLPAQLITAALMWSVMTVAMMVPTAVPALAIFDTMARQRPAGCASITLACFAAGYVVAWIGFAVIASFGQMVLSGAALLSPMLISTSTALSAAILCTAGAYQISPLKNACLSKCRSPLGFLLAEWRDGYAGAFALGIRHGGYCIGCCWALMALLLVVGAMNLLWMSVLTVFMLAEKVVPRRWRLQQVAGIAAIAGGILIASGIVN